MRLCANARHGNATCPHALRRHDNGTQESGKPNKRKENGFPKKKIVRK